MNTLILAQGLPVNETLSTYSDLAFRTAFGIYVLALIASLVYYGGFRVAKVSEKELVAAGGTGLTESTSLSSTGIADDERAAAGNRR